MGSAYARAACAHRIAEALDIPFGAAWRISNCINKVSYPHEEEAAKAAESYRGYGEQRPYQCEICGRWHLSSQRREE